MKKRTFALLVTLLALALMLAGCDKTDYDNAVGLYEGGQYEEAIAAFEALGDYQDSAARVLDCKMGLAQKEIEAGNFDAALTTLAELGDYEGAAEAVTQCNLGIAKQLLDGGDAKAAADKYLEEFANSGSAEAAEGVVSSIAAVAETDLTAASEIYGKVPDGAKTDSFQFVGGDMLLRLGRLNDAKNAYNSVPAGFSYNGATVEERLELLAAHGDLLAICGEWGCSKDGTASIRQTHDSTGLWDQWDFDLSGNKLTVLCPYDIDAGTFKIIGTATYGYCKNYSTLSANVNVGEATASFTVNGAALPANLPMDNDHVSMSYSGNAFNLSYQVVDDSSSMNFTYTVSGSCVYDTVKKPW